ncbi:calponin homology domain-containing protein DDB_G0272472 isoform X1 [Astyanax mexicanus]|uniref:calponin homology domain-containing protein DDB_G0272472 isoform X1 n=1 Tax=Astyanax mexicanus TaxID=7994 RepID=UPI0020CB037C|nr:calponin homology domain-containing protein DDB_G0272472 isoform X1 [Astyanax mexicanus]
MSLADQQWLTARAKVSVLQARGLRIKGKEGAHALLQVGAQRFSTVKAQQQRADPVWDGQEAAFELTGFPENSADLRVQVLQRALVGPDKVLGHVDIDLGELYSDKTRDKIQWFKLLGKPGKPEKERGEIQLEIQFLKGSMSASMFDLSGPDKSRSKMGKLKDKLRGKKKEGLSDSASAIVPSVTQILTDSEGEEGEELASPEKKKKNKLKSLFAPKSGLRRDSSQSMSTLSSFPERDSAIASSTSSGLNAESPEGKKKFKFLTHRRTGSSDSKNSQSAFKHEAPPQVSINGSHVYREEEPENKGSALSLTSSGHGSMEELRREREERERMEEERIRVEREEEERKKKEKEAAEQRQKIEAEKERMRLEREKEEQRKKAEEERQRKQKEAEEQQRKIEEERQRKEREAEEQRKVEEEKERMRLEREKEEQERKRKEREAEEQRQKIEEEKERIRLQRVKEEEQMRKTEKERQRKEREAEEQRMVDKKKEIMRLEREKEEKDRSRKEKEAVEQRQKIEEEKERMRLEREAEEKRRKIEEERQKREREAEEQRRKIEEEKEIMRLEREKEEQEKKRKEREAEEQRAEKERKRFELEKEEKKKLEEEKQRKEREAEEQRRKIEEEEKARQITEEKERNRKEEENKKRQEAERLAEEKKAREEEERRRKRVAEEEEAEKQKRICEEEERKEKERIRLEEERKNLEMEERKKREREVKEAEQDLRPVPKARTGKVSTASKPQEETLSEAESSNNPFETSEPEEPPSSNPFEEPNSPQPPASVRSARVSAVKPSTSLSRTISQPPVVNTNPFFDNCDDSFDGSLENFDSIERSTERSGKKGHAPLPPQNKLEMPKSIANSGDILLEETKPCSPLKEVSRRPAPQPPGGLKKTTEDPDRHHQCPTTLGQEWDPLEGPERPQSHGQERKPLVGPENPQLSKVISKDELKAWCIQSMKLGKGQNSSPQKADPIHNQAPTHQLATYSGHRDFSTSQNQSSKKPADANPFTGDGPVPVPARHNKGPAPAKPSSQKTLSEDESSNICSSPKSPSVELAPLENELSSKDTTAEPLKTINLDNLPRQEKVEEHLNKIDEPECLQWSSPSSVSQDVLSQELFVSKSDGLPNLDSLSREALARTEVAKKKSQAPLPPAKPKRIGDPGNQLPSVSASKSKVDLEFLPQSQRNKNFQDQPKDTTPTTTSSSTPLAAKSEMKKVGVSMPADSGPGSGSKSLPLARVVPTDVQSSAGDLKGAGGASASVIRPHAVKPLSAIADKQPDLRETSTSKAAGGTDNTQPKPEAAETGGKGPYSQLTRAELVSLVVRQQDQLSQRDRRIGELELYIDSLLVRVMEEQPSILMSLSSQKKTV